jgi:photosystem II PsbT protein
MEALVYTSLVIGTLGVIFFAIFFRQPPRMRKLSGLSRNGFFSVNSFFYMLWRPRKIQIDRRKLLEIMDW